MPKTRFSLVFLFFMGVSLVSCHRQKASPPVDDTTMTAVLLDIELAESYSTGLGADSGKVRDKFEKNRDSLAAFYADILTHHHLSLQEFNEAITWYQAHPERMDSLLSEVIDALNKLKAQHGISDITAKQKDSVNEASLHPDTADAARLRLPEKDIRKRPGPQLQKNESPEPLTLKNDS